jgi:hypothetical protein
VKTDQYPDWTATDKEPDKTDTEAFLTAFATECANEGKAGAAATLKTNRVMAIQFIRDYFVQVNSPTCMQYPYVNRYRFAIELALRIRRPALIDQGSEVFCGPASVYHGFFKTQPGEAAQFACNLVDYGRARLRGYTLEPLSSVKDSPMPPTIEYLAPVDWVLLATLRHHIEPLAELASRFMGEKKASPLRELTKPALLASWLQKMGYKPVHDRTFLIPDDVNNPTWILDGVSRYSLPSTGLKTRKQQEDDLALATLELNDPLHPCLIFLWGYGQLSEFAPLAPKSKLVPFPTTTKTPDTEKFWEIFPGLHWTLVRKLHPTGTHVELKFNTWGQTRAVSYPRDQFFHVYRGHVSAQIL